VRQDERTQLGSREGRWSSRAPGGCQGRARPIPRASAGVVLALTVALGPGVPSSAAQGGRGTLVCSATDNGEPAQGTVRVVSPGGDVVARGKTGRPLRVPAGRHRVEVRLEGTLDGTPKVETVAIRPGRRATLEVAFTTGTLTVEVEDADGQPTVARLTFVRDGREVGSGSAGVTYRLGAGVYEVRVRRLDAEETVEGVRVEGGQDRTTRVRMGD